MKNKQALEALKAKLKEKRAQEKRDEDAQKEAEQSVTDSPTSNPGEMTFSKMRFAQTPIQRPDQKLWIGQLICLHWIDSDIQLAGRVSKITSNGIRLEFVRPVDAFWESGQRVQIEAWDKEGEYAFGSVIRETFSDPRPGLCISRPTTGHAAPRRKSKGLKASVPFSFVVLNADEAELTGKGVPYARTENLSLGGMAFDSDLPLTRGDQLKVSLTLPLRSQRVKLIARVVRCSSSQRSRGRSHFVSLQFTDVPPTEFNALLLFLARVDPGSAGPEI